MARSYKKDYDRGWNASIQYGKGKGSGLEGADDRGEPSAWYDGYYDHAADRDKYATPDSKGINRSAVW